MPDRGRRRSEPKTPQGDIASKGGARRKGREFALGLLFMADVGGLNAGGAIIGADETLDMFFEQWQMALEERQKLRVEIEDFGRRLFEAYFRDAKVIDQIINELSHDWAIDRMPGIDRNILRMALAELRHLPDVPTSAAINEAVELAKTYGTPESGKFVNGILGAYARREKLIADAQ
ncbi:MAG: transcription antitermination factor NusB [Armatimonadetes bacterium]|nr:transcription antitermination factor NusB [Armatimonadota bacterium]